MRFNFGFFGTQEHRVFNYKPRYYDPEKEELRQMFGKVDGRLDDSNEVSKTAPQDGQNGKVDGQNGKVDNLNGKVDGQDRAANGKQEHKYVPGSLVKGSLRNGNYQEQHGHGGKLQKIIGLVAMILMFVVMFLIIRSWPYIVAGLQQ